MANYSAGGFAGHVPGKISTGSLKAKVELRMSCSNLVNKDLASKSDPMCIVFERSGTQQMWHEVDRTEKIMNNLNPVWERGVVFEYKFEGKQHLKFEIWDVDKDVKGEVENFKKQDLLGSFETTLGQLLYNGGLKGPFEATLANVPGKKASTSKIKIVVKSLSDNDRILKIKFSGKGLDSKDFLGKSDPFLVLLRDDSSDATKPNWVPLGQTEVIKNNLNPKWKSLKVPVCRLTEENGTPKRLKLEVYDWDSDKKRELIGSCNTDLVGIKKSAADKTEFHLINEEKAAKKKASSPKESGRVVVRSIKEVDPNGFMTSLRSGVSLNFAIALDFTASNGNPNKPESLHYIGNGMENQYTSTIKAVGDILEDYDADRNFPGFGFGAIVPQLDPKEAQHDFPLSMDSLYCVGVQGLLDAYKMSLSRVQLHGPTCFAPVIERVAEMASSSSVGYAPGGKIPYQVLMIITDGAICDMDKCKRAIVKASELPMSIIIVGVGKEDFTAMAELDGDYEKPGRGLKDSSGNEAKRDIVQFVQLRDFSAETPSGGLEYDTAGLAKEVLAELPDQISSFLDMKKIPRH